MPILLKFTTSKDIIDISLSASFPTKRPLIRCYIKKKNFPCLEQSVEAPSTTLGMSLHKKNNIECITHEKEEDKRS